MWAPLRVGVTSQEAALVFGVFLPSGQSGARCDGEPAALASVPFPGPLANIWRWVSFSSVQQTLLEWPLCPRLLAA